MGSWVTRGASRLIRARNWYLALCLLVTAVLAAGAARMPIGTRFADLLPLHNPIVQVFKRYERFAEPLNVQILIKATRGTIYTPSVLDTIYRLTRQIDLIPDVDHVSVTSIASSKIRVARATPSGLESVAVMPDRPPRTAREAAQIRARVREARGVTGILVSRDESAALLEAGFHEDGIDYATVFNDVHEMLRRAKTPEVEFYPAGRVMLIGWVQHYGNEAVFIFVISFALVALALIDYMRSLAGAATPLIVAAVSTIWGIGAGGWMGLGLEPLTLVVPVLLMARALSHSVQITRRYYETLDRYARRDVAAVEALNSMFAPACLGILCDAAGLFMLFLAPIPIIRNLGQLCGTWSLLLIPSVVLLTPALLAVMPAPIDVGVFVRHETPSLIVALAGRVQRGLLRLLAPGWRRVSACALIVLALLALTGSLERQVGNVSVGSPLLWPNNEFNVAEAHIDRNLAGTVTFNVVWQGRVPHALAYPATYASMRRFERAMARMHGAQASFSIADLLPRTNRLVNGGDPKWLPVDLSKRTVANDLFWTLAGHSLEDVAQLATPDMRSGDVVLWYKDLRASSVNRAMAAVRAALAQTAAPSGSPVCRIRLAAGPVALQYATDHVVARANWRIMGYLLAAIFVMVTATYYSPVAAILLLVPLAFAQFANDSVMFLRGMGLDLNTLPVVAVGLGVGIDYGIYLLSRICEEYQAAGDGDVAAAATRAILTTGEAISFIALTMVISVLPWYFLSNLRFLAEMGLLLALVMAFNWLLALTVLPLEVTIIKPRFLGRLKLMHH
ncbi:MAG TPA: MMPL family transporter [Candidatus Binataceae bacterium]|nr:MMPL family transporter [Candidatus Binataceae bacterium]